MIDLQEDKAAEILREVNQMAADRSVFDTHCNDIAAKVLPIYQNTFGLTGHRPNGEKLYSQIYDATASTALDQFSAILDSLLTPRNQRWQRLTSLNPKLQKSREARLWYEESTRVLFKYRYAPQSNFVSQNKQVWSSVGAFGNGILFTDEMEQKPGVKPGIRYKFIPLNECYFRQNHQGIVDTLYRYFSMTAREAFKKWGMLLPESITSKVQNSPDTKFWFCHCVRPRHDYDPQRIDVKGMAFESIYVSVDGKKVITEGGYTSFPFSVARYNQQGGEVTGRGPAMSVWPAINTANEQKKTLLKQGHRAVDPVLLTHDDGILDTFSLRPGAVNPGGVSADGRPLVHALPVGNVSIGKDMIDDERKDIKDAFLVNLFQILTENPQMTATEVVERSREKGFLLNPTIGGIETEYLGGLTDRELDLLSKNGLLPPMPQILQQAEGEYSLVYESPLARAAQAEEASGLMRTVEHALTVVNATQDPAPLDYFNWDVIIPEISHIQGVPEKWMRSEEDVASIRDGRAQSAQQEQEVQAAPAAAAMVKAQAMATKGK